MDNYQNKPSSIPNFLFSYMNFEDFLSMHLEQDKVNRWWVLCNGRNHFNSPSHSSEYISEFEEFIGEYRKGDMPIDFDCHSLDNLKINQENESIPFKS